MDKLSFYYLKPMVNIISINLLIIKQNTGNNIKRKKDKNLL